MSGIEISSPGLPSQLWLYVVLTKCKLASIVIFICTFLLNAEADVKLVTEWIFPVAVYIFAQFRLNQLLFLCHFSDV